MSCCQPGKMGRWFFQEDESQLEQKPEEEGSLGGLIQLERTELEEVARTEAGVGSGPRWGMQPAYGVGSAVLTS